MFLGIEIGGTKLQLGVGRGDSSPMVSLQRRDVDAAQGAAGIRAQIDEVAAELMAQHEITKIGIGFGGPVDRATGRVTTSHQVEGWDDFAFVAWCEEKFRVPAVLGNDCDAAALAEARFGAGEGARRVFFITVGTGVGGGFVVDGHLYGSDRPAVAEIGHLRPQGFGGAPEVTVEALASGRGIETVCRDRLANTTVADSDRDDLLKRAGGNAPSLTARAIAEASAEGNELARTVLRQATETLGWAIAQMVTLLAPEVVVLGGGVSLVGEEGFFRPLREAVARFVFPPLVGSFRIAPAKLGELVVVHGALALAAEE